FFSLADSSAASTPEALHPPRARPCVRGACESFLKLPDASPPCNSKGRSRRVLSSCPEGSTASSLLAVPVELDDRIGGRIGGAQGCLQLCHRGLLPPAAHAG